MVLVLSACAGYKIPDSEVCVELPSHKAFCTYTLSDIERTITESDWEKFAIGRFSLSPQDFAKYQNFITEVCIKEKCTKDQKKTLNKWKKLSEEALKMVP